MEVTGIIIAGNEQKMIEKSIKSLSWCKQVILVAANSTDNTISVAKKVRPSMLIIKINDTYGKNFDKWRNAGLEKVKTKYTFYLDADEEASLQLQGEIEGFTKQKEYTYAAIPRQNMYLGKIVKHGGSYPDYQKRLFKTDKLEKWEGLLHEQPIVTGKLYHLKNSILHNTHRSLHEMTKKTLIWTDSFAGNIYKSNHPPMQSWRIFRMFFTKFMERYIKQSMWRDGTVGLISSIFESFDTVIIYSKLWELQKV